MQKVVVVPLAKGFEELEAVSIIDVLRRAGAKVVIAGLDSTELVESQGGIFIHPDTKMELIEPQNIDMVVLPGGWGGTLALANHKLVQAMICNLNERKRFVAAICAAPYALSEAGIALTKYTCYPSVEEKIPSGEYLNDRVVEADHIITSRGPGSALVFSLTLVERLFNREKRDEVARAMLASDL
ncbi:MAG: DJ-1 family glyoxalase III [Wolinella sp.]